MFYMVACILSLISTAFNCHNMVNNFKIKMSRQLEIYRPVAKHHAIYFYYFQFQ